ncbi:hypothetical protein BCh11DRAFT_06098 [Burkholderia sp. Ch1-1]|nr:hypothetical protein BCh11DRAFT_06098 [Burkholderia sp. Ch1-1]
MTIELNFEGNSPLNGYMLLENIVLPPDLYTKLRELAISKVQSPDAMARLLIEQSLSSASARRRYTLADLDEQPDATL